MKRFCIRTLTITLMLAFTCTNVVASGRVHFERARELARVESWNAAIAEYDLAIREDPAFAGAYYYKAIALENLGMLDDAVVAYDLAIGYNLEFADVCYSKGALLRRLGRHERERSLVEQST